MNTILVIISFNIFLLFARWNVSASEMEDSFEVLNMEVKSLCLPDNIVNEYYESGEYEGLIKQQFTLIANEDPISIGRFSYDPQSITVIDAFDSKTVYRKESGQSIMEKYDALGNLSHKEIAFIQDSKLIGKNLEDGNGNTLVCERYLYNESGELIKTKVYSNVEELNDKIEDNIIPANEMFQYLNGLLNGQNLGTIQELTESYFGSLYLVLTGYYNHPLETGVFGFGEVDDKVRVTFINGILNRNLDCMENAKSISRTHGGVNVHYVYRPTNGWANDLLNGVPDRFGILSSQATLLGYKWKELIAEMGGTNSGGIIIHYAHSIGASDTWNARTLLTPEEKKLVRVVTIGSPFMIHKDGLHSVVNYVSVRDGVSYLDPFGFYNGCYDEDSNVVLLGSWKDGFPIIDHPLSTLTYQALLYKLGKEFIDTYGCLQSN